MTLEQFFKEGTRGYCAIRCFTVFTLPTDESSANAILKHFKDGYYLTIPCGNETSNQGRQICVLNIRLDDVSRALHSHNVTSFVHTDIDSGFKHNLLRFTIDRVGMAAYLRRKSIYKSLMDD